MLLRKCPLSGYDANLERRADRANLGSAIGAGDTFVAGVMYGLLCRTGDWGVQRTVRFAVDLATIKVQQDGFDGLASKLSPAGDG